MDGGVQLTFKADAHLLRVLGEELIATEKVGLLELVKNAFDAQATLCRVLIERVPNLSPVENSNYETPDLPGPVIIIEDNGIGMDQNTIENGWLRPASTIKTSIKNRLASERREALEHNRSGTYEAMIRALKKEYRGRIPLGEKGVGRFATRRLGKRLLITTKTKDKPYEYVLEIDWDQFDETGVTGTPKNLESVSVALFRQPLSRNYGKANSGTRLTIYGGREGFELSEAVIRDINMSILRFKSPYKAPEKFDIAFACPQLENLESGLPYEEIKPTFTFDGIVDERGLCDFELVFSPPPSVALPKETIKEKRYDLRAGNPYWAKDRNLNLFENSEDEEAAQPTRTPDCGLFYIRLNIWYRTNPWIEKLEIKDFTKYLDDFGGVSVFRDGINVFPSDSGAQLDWLGLSVRHIKRGTNLSYYNMLGTIELDQTSNPLLQDKTNREGFLKNRAYLDLAELTKKVVYYCELHFKGKREKLEHLSGEIVREPKTLTNLSSTAASVMRNLSEHFDAIPNEILAPLGPQEVRKERLLNVEQSLRKLHKNLEALENVHMLLTEQAGYGLAVAVSVHEIAKLTSNFYEQVVDFVKGRSDEDTLSSLKNASKALKTELKRLGPLRAIRSESRKEFDVLHAAKFAFETYRNRLEKEKINIQLEGKGFEVYARYGAITQVFANLIDNSIYWLSVKNTRQRFIRVRLDYDERTVVFADSGPGIDESIRPYLFQAGYSLKIPPSGLGLYIAKHYLNEVRSEMTIAPKSMQIADLSGAQFLIDFSHTAESKELA